ncbi:MAG: hypothetical protein AB7N65_17795 [Vicinamibacterales bacterium]
MTAAVLAGANATLAWLVLVAQRQMAFEPPSVAAIALYMGSTAGMFVCYGGALRLGSRAPVLERRTTMALLAGPVVVWLALTPTLPSLSIDLYSYLGHGHQVAGGVNPYTAPVATIAGTRYGDGLTRLGWLPAHGRSPYGPIWTRLETAAHGTDRSIVTQARWLKGVTTGAGLAVALLLWFALGRFAPEQRLCGLILYLWNPLVMFEIAGEGHNDAVMLAFLVLGLLLVALEWRMAAAATLAAAALVKATALLVVPPVAWHVARRIWVDRREAGRRAQAIAGPLLAVVLVCVAGWWMYGELWVGAATFDGLRQHARPQVTPSTAGTLYWYASQTHSEAASAIAVRVAVHGLLVGSIAIVSLRTTTVRETFGACAVASVAGLLLSTSYWPWYVVVPVALYALAPTSAYAIPTVMALSAAGRLVAPIERLRIQGVGDWPTATVLTTVVGLWLPALIVAALALAGGLRELSHVWSSRGSGVAGPWRH